MENKQAMNTQMSMDEYKQEVIKWMEKLVGPISDERKTIILNLSDELWEQYKEDFNPEICAQGIISGLI